MKNTVTAFASAGLLLRGERADGLKESPLSEGTGDNHTGAKTSSSTVGTIYVISEEPGERTSYGTIRFNGPTEIPVDKNGRIIGVSDRDSYTMATHVGIIAGTVDAGASVEQIEADLTEKHFENLKASIPAWSKLKPPVQEMILEEALKEVPDFKAKAIRLKNSLAGGRARLAADLELAGFDLCLDAEPIGSDS